MSATIASSTVTVTFQIYRGQLLPVQPVGDFYARLGQTGEGSQEVISLGPDCDIEAHYLLAWRTAARNAQADISAWQSKYLAITEPDGKVWSRVLCKSAEARVLVGRYPYGATTYTYRVACRFILAVQS